MLAALVLALALASDATAAAAVRGMVAARIQVRDALLIATLTGSFQGGMAAIGWQAGDLLGPWFARFDHWIAFGLLVAIGGKTAWEGLRSNGDPDDVDPVHPFALAPLSLLALATSIDAAAAGVTVPLLPVTPPVTLALIAGVTFVMTFAGTYVGRAVGARFGRGLEVAGGLVLVALGVKILVEHLTAG